MTLESSKILYAHFLEIGRVADAEQLLIRFPELKEKPKEEPVIEKVKEVKPVGKVPKR